MQDDKSYQSLTALCSDSLKKVKAIKNKLETDFAMQEAQEKDCVNLRVHVPSEGRVILPSTARNLIRQAQENEYHYRLIINQQTPDTEPIWNIPVFPILLTTEECETIQDVLAKSKVLTKKFRDDFLKELPEYPHIKKMFQYWDEKTQQRYQAVLDKKLALFWPTLLEYMLYPNNKKVMQAVDKHIDSLETLFHMENSFGQRIHLKIGNSTMLDRIQAVSPQLGHSLSACFKHVNRHKEVHVELQKLRDHLCLTR